jgi:streptogramin lyase
VTYENAANPDGFIRESHPYRIVAGSDGWLWIADAGANTLLRANPTNGRIERVATFGGLPIPFPNPSRNNMMETDPVPSGVAEAPNGNVFVSFLPGAPLAPGMGKVVLVDAMGGVSDFAVNLTTPTDLAFGPDGALYAIQFAVFGEQGPQPGTGAIVRIGLGDSSVAVVEGLVFPTAIDFDDAGNAYVTVNGVGAPGSGQVVRFDGLAAP